MTTKRVVNSDVTASVNPMSTLNPNIRLSFEHGMELTTPVKHNAELENSNSNYLSKDIVVKDETFMITGFNVRGRAWSLFGGGLFYGSFWTMGGMDSDAMSMCV